MKATPSSTNKIRVLVIEDEAIAARDICQQLSEQGYEPVGKTAPLDQAIIAAEKLRPDLVLMDMKSTGNSDRISVAHEIRDRLGLPVVFLSVSADHDVADRTGESASLGYTINPFAEQELRTAIEIALFKHQAETRLRHSEARHSKMVANIADVIVIIDSAGVIRYTSPNLERLFGWNPEEVIATGAFDRVHPDDLYSTRTFIGALWETPNATGTTEFRYRCKNGDYRWIEFTGVNLAHDPDIGGLLGDFHDITVRKHSESRLRLQGNALDAAANAIVITNRQGVVEWVNAAFATLTGYNLSESVGKNPGDLLRSGKQNPAFFKSMWTTILAGEVWHGEIINRRKDGTLYNEDMTITPMKTEAGEITHFIAIKQDITQRKSLEAQLVQAQKMEAIGLLAGGVAHDFNNILAVVLLYLGLMQDDPAPGANNVLPLKQLEKEVRRGASLTRQLLAFSRQQAIEPTRLDLNSVLEGLLKMLHRLLGEQITIIHERPEMPMITEADEGMLEQVVMNLCINARDAMPRDGKLRLAVDRRIFTTDSPLTHAEARPGRFLCLSITDTGSGMDASTLRRIFEPFFTTKELGKGTGLGLAIVHGIIKQHRGWIEVESTLGEGTAFRLYLPESEIPGIVIDSVNIHPSLERGRGETILVTEDEAGLRSVMARVLRQHGYNVIEAADGPQALDRWRQCGERIDILITDMIMPGGMNGQELIEQLQNEQHDLRVVVCTGYSPTENAVPLVEDPRVTMLRKPFDLSALLATTRQTLDRK